MFHLVIDTGDDEMVQLSIRQIAAGEGKGDGSWTETVKELGRIDLDLEEIQTFNDVIERWMYAAIDRKHHGESDRPRGR
jgi:hypothetical protein